MDTPKSDHVSRERELIIEVIQGVASAMQYRKVVSKGNEMTRWLNVIAFIVIGWGVIAFMTQGLSRVLVAVIIIPVAIAIEYLFVYLPKRWDKGPNSRTAATSINSQLVTEKVGEYVATYQKNHVLTKGWQAVVAPLGHFSRRVSLLGGGVVVTIYADFFSKDTPIFLVEEGVMPDDKRCFSDPTVLWAALQERIATNLGLNSIVSAYGTVLAVESLDF